MIFYDYEDETLDQLTAPDCVCVVCFLMFFGFAGIFKEENG